MAFGQFERERLEGFENDLHPSSLARRANWPHWAQELSADTTCSRTLLQRIDDYGRNTLVYLGTSYDVRLGEQLVPRQTRSTDIGGFYYHVSPHIMLVDDFEPAIMRATISRHTIWDRRQERLWSGWFPAYDRLWLMTHRDIVSPLPLGTQFVAVCDIKDVDPVNIYRPEGGGPEVFCYEAIEPIMCVPVRASDLSPYLIIIDEPGIDRSRAEEIYQAARQDLVRARQLHKLVPFNYGGVWPISLSK